VKTESGDIFTIRIGEMKNHSMGISSNISPPGPMILDIFGAGGLLVYVAQRK
jgi:hypothetical protein